MQTVTKQCKIAEKPNSKVTEKGTEKIKNRRQTQDDKRKLPKLTGIFKTVFFSRWQCHIARRSIFSICIYANVMIKQSVFLNEE